MQQFRLLLLIFDRKKKLKKKMILGKGVVCGEQAPLFRI